MTNSIDHQMNFGSIRAIVGTITPTDTQTSEDIDVGMSQVVFMVATYNSSNTLTAGTTGPYIDEAGFPIAGSAITVNFAKGTELGTGGKVAWMALGY